ncbi:GNAT family N-acetyltransferase [Rugosimonospora acidiphila]|uniref:GNAT family N-acetyltransferase n=1 Tax=Rugosimonospora acidiphila TaxID=556531 RepID=A0ABP9RRH6_9ACTN
MLIEPRESTDPIARQLILEQQAEVAVLQGAGHVEYRLRADIEFMLGLIDGHPVGCGALQPITAGIGEVRRVYVRPAYRGQGLSKLILAALEERAFERGYHTLRLEAGRMMNRAIGLYRAAGFAAIPAYGEYAGNPQSVCFEKSLVAALA